MSFQRIVGENNTTKHYKDSLSHYYVPNARIKYFNVLIDGKRLFDLPVKDPQQINFIGKLLNTHGAAMFLIEKSEETTFSFSQNSVTII